MTNAGVVGFPSGASGAVADGSVAAGKLAAPLGSWGKLVSGNYYITAGLNSTTTNNNLGTGTLRLVPWFVPNACTLSRIGAAVTNAGDSGSKVRLGIYADSGSGYPGALVLDAGTIAGDSATVQEITINQVLSAGLYWIGGVVQVVTVTQPTCNAITTPGLIFNGSTGSTQPAAAHNIIAYQQGSVAGALPAVFSTTLSTGSSAPRVFVKVA